MVVAQQKPQYLYLARHGQTALNAAGRLRGLADPPLDDIGELEARRLAEVFTQHAPALVISSPLQRAARTAQIIAGRSGVPFVADQRFNDRDYGPQTGKVKEAVVAEWGSVDNAPGVEPVSAVLARARPALDAVLDAAKGGPIVVVTHDAVIRPLIEMIDSRFTHLLAPTGSWNQLLRKNQTWSVRLVDQRPAE
jgi:broad specificity phosphatase PhoE